METRRAPLTSLVSGILPPQSITPEQRMDVAVEDERILLKYYDLHGDWSFATEHNLTNSSPANQITPRLLEKHLSEPGRGATPDEIRNFRLTAARHLQELASFPDKQGLTRKFREIDRNCAIFCAAFGAFSSALLKLPPEFILAYTAGLGIFSYAVIRLSGELDLKREIEQRKHLESGEELIQLASVPTMRERRNKIRTAKVKDITTSLSPLIF